MLFVIHALDRPDSRGLRETHSAAHGGFLGSAEARGTSILFSGPLVSNSALDDDKPIGSLLVIDAADINGAEQFIAADPLNVAGVYEKIAVNRFIKKRG